ncbi:MAG: winged helix-turn-helix transcriptional regulator [Armatimonadetes bacterium]|nr:winged helix-turn-helix transcriptional regulator [Armatimonadota bacterium]
MHDIISALKALADPTRLRVIVLLVQVPDGVCVCELVDALRLPQYQVSRHLSLLRAARLVEGRRRGTWVFYRLRSGLPRAVTRVLRAIGAAGSDGPAAEDRQRLHRRLRLRQDGVCVVGYVPDHPFREIIPVRPLPVSKGATHHAPSTHP